ncbi:MAG: tetratricopeptide repeat protein, partial [Polyangiaceae bacterium]
MKSKIFGLGLSLSLFSVAACGGDAAKPAQPPPPVAMASAAPANGPDMSNDSAASTSPDIARGTKLLQAGEYADAKAAFQAALTKSPHDAPDAHFYLGEVAEKQNDKATAEKEYKEALKLRPDFLEPIQNLSAVYLEGQRWDDALAIIKPALAKHADDPSL